MNILDAEAWIGTLIGHRYRLDGLIASGGMGDVFLANDTRLGRRVALKLLKGELTGTGTFIRRFEREVQVCTHLESPHIVQISDYGVTGDEKPYYVMEYLQGETLGQRLKREKPLPVIVALQIMLQVCLGLQAAHAGVSFYEDGRNHKHKIVHRDLKPDNFFLVPLATGILVKILDFGIAKVCYDEMAEKSRHLTGTNFFLGTPRYAAPEQVDQQEQVDERADIYSLGFILYEMLSGVDPFGFDQDPQTHSWVSWAMAHTSKPTIPLRSQPNCEHLAPALESVVRRCLQKEPGKRFASVQELQKALQTVLNQIQNQEQNQNHDQSPTPPVASDRPSTGTVASAAVSKVMSRLPKPLLQPGQLSSPSATPAPPPPLPSLAQTGLGLSQHQHQQLEQRLRTSLGPMAKLLLQEALEQTVDIQHLPQTLSQHLPPAQQAAFAAEVQSLLTQPAKPPAPSPRPQGNTLPQTQTYSQDHLPTSAASTAGQLTPEWIGQCQTELTHWMGPMGPLLVRQMLAQYPQSTRQAFVEALAQHLNDPAAAQSFRQKLL